MRNNHRHLVATVLAASALLLMVSSTDIVSHASASTRPSANAMLPQNAGEAAETKPGSGGAEDASARVTSLAFLAGTWQGEMNGSFVEEIWSAPKGNNIVGTFRWLKPDGRPAMFEMLAITQEGDDVQLRLRHYSQSLASKEPGDKPLTLMLAESSASRALFKAEKDAGALAQITYEVKNDVLHIVVEFVASDPPREALTFSLDRVKNRAW